MDNQILDLAHSSFISQFRGPSNINEDANEENSNCGPVCLAMLAKIYGVRDIEPDNANAVIEEMRGRADGDISEYSPTTLSGLNSALTGLGLETWLFDQTATFKVIEQQLRKGRKCILYIRGEHFVIAVGFQGKKIIIADPAESSPSVWSRKEIESSMPIKSMISVAEPLGLWLSVIWVFVIGISFSLMTWCLLAH